MPRLLRLRFLSVGHAGARFDDLLLDLRDRDGDATDSTLWLRNGGGKTSLLSLFFALLRPDKREFLGLKVTGKTEGHPNELKDFIMAEDRSVVVSEWVLDGGASLFADAQPQRYLTGVFYERRSGADDDVQRLFFAGYVAGDDPAMQITGLPLYASTERRARRTLSAFRQEWLALRERHPALQAVCTDNQREWGQILDGVGIDTELFAYQLRMNRRESGADELFRFSEHERFIDFLLEVAHTSELGDRLRQNLSTLRKELIERKDRLKPEQELIAGLAERLGPLTEIARERQQQRDASGQVRAELNALRDYVAERLTALETERETTNRAQESARRQAVQAKQDAAAAERRAAELRLHAASARQKQAKEDLSRLGKEREEALRQRHIWEAAVPLRAALNAEQRVSEHRQALDAQQTDQAPLLSQTEQAADRFAAALAHEISTLNGAAAQHDVVAEEADTLARHANSEAAALRTELKQIRTSIEQHLIMLREIENRREQLTADGVLRAGETCSFAITRLTEAKHAANAEAEEAYSAEKRHRAESEQLTADLRTVERRQQEFTAKASSLAQALEESSEAERALCKNPLLAQLFQVETKAVELEPLLDRALAQLPEEGARVEKDILQLRTDLAADERACHALERTGLLPPSSDVEMLLACLPRAWSGWQYLAANARSNTVRRERVHAAPHLAAGIVVRDEDWTQATEALARTAELPSSPVAIGRAGVLLESTASGDYQVIGPRSDAYFDKTAGKAELKERRERLGTNQDKLTSLGHMREEIDDLRHRLTDFRKRWPLGWRVAKEQEKRTAEAEARDLSSQAVTLAERIRDLGRLETDARSKGEQAARRTQEHGAACFRVQSFAQDHEARERPIRNALASSEAAARDLPNRIAIADDAANTNSERSKQSREESQGHKLRAQLLTEERQRIRYLHGEVAAHSGQIDALRIHYEECRDLYEQRVSQDGLQHLLRREEKEANEARQTLARKLEVAKKGREGGRPILTEAEVLAALQTLTDQNRLEARLEEANKAYDSAHGANARQAQEVQNADKQWSDSAQRARDLGVEVEAVASAPCTDPVVIDHEAGAAEAEAKQHAEESAAKERVASQAGLESQRLWQKQDGLRKDERHIVSFLDSYSDVLLDAYPVGVLHIDVASLRSDAAVELRTSEVAKRLAELRTTQEKLGTRRAEASRRVRSYAKDRRFEPLGSPIAQRFADATDADLETSAAPLHEELLTRLKALSEQLASLDKHREFLIDIALEAAREGLKLLDAAAASSRVPDHVPGLGGAQFLRIMHSAPLAPGDRRARIGELIDKVLEKELPSGLGLVQQSVRELAKPIRARVLHPDPHREQRSVEIPDLARFSGGERLTCAVLLYCTLAQLRAKTRGSARLPSSVLFLDNPIGASSRVKFLDIQRDVAQAMRIQLVYTTGVNDLDALATLPNVIRLRNDRIDRARGQRHVEHAPDGERQIGATRILLPSPPSVAPAEGP